MDGPAMVINRGHIGQVVNKRENFMPGRNDFLYDVHFFETPEMQKAMKQVKQRAITCTAHRDDPNSGFSIRRCSKRCTACKDMLLCLTSRQTVQNPPE
jgi:hypothetical protein